MSESGDETLSSLSSKMVPCYGFSHSEGISSLLSRLPIFIKFPENIFESLVEEVQMLLEMGREKVCVCLSVCLSDSHTHEDHRDYFCRRTRSLQTVQSRFPRPMG